MTIIISPLLPYHNPSVSAVVPTRPARCTNCEKGERARRILFATIALHTRQKISAGKKKEQNILITRALKIRGLKKCLCARFKNRKNAPFSAGAHLVLG
jgi:hypothetical protein